VLGRFFHYETYYIVEYDLSKDWLEADFLPRIEDFTLKIVTTNQEADELGAQGLEFRSYVINARERLDKGAIAFCIFVGQELAYIAWLAMSQQAKDVLDEPPFRVNFSDNEACWGGLWTSPQYRRMGLGTYGAFKRMQFMRERGKVIVRGAVAKDNVASLTMGTTHGQKRPVEARYLRILWWKSWKEKPLTIPAGE